MKKRVLSILLALCMVLCLAPTAAFAEGSTAPADITGTGASDDPYLIYTAAGLKAFRDKVNGQNGLMKQPGAHAKLMNDIVLNDGTFDADGYYTPGASGKAAEAWTPIGYFKNDSDKSRYAGTFDGGGHTIKGLYVTGVEYAGLFGYAMNATIKNVAMDGYITTERYSGGIAGYLSGGSVTSCFNYCTLNSKSTSGGIAGFIAEQCKITGCGNAGSVSGTNIGGVVGYAKGKCVIQNCYNVGAVSTYSCAGGIAGDSFSSSIIACYNTGTVIMSENAYGNAYVGGIIGNAFNSGSIYFSYWLKGTARNAAGYDPEGTMLDPEKTVLAPDAKTKEEFADGTVLGLLKKGETLPEYGRRDFPWEKCGYLSAAGMTLPLLDWQTADSHTHTPGAVLGQCDCGASITDGSPEKPYEIYNAAQLKQFRDKVNGGESGVHAKLMNDIVLNDGTFDENGNWSEGGTPDQWTPINDYTGTFDGNGHTIKGLYIVKDGEVADSVGLFGYLKSGTVKNLAVTGYVTISTSMPGSAGGIAGEVYGGAVEDCVNLCRVVTDISDVGGIAGIATYSSTITNCANLGEISGGIDNGDNVGGVVGALWFDSTMTGCFNVGRVTNGGGIVGYPDDDKVVNSYYLTGTAEKAAIKGNVDNDAAAKAKSDFANGAVLGLLQNGDTNSPWAKTGYLETAKMTLPLLDWQAADDHNHNYNWKHTDTEHWKECACGLIDKNSKGTHSGTDDGDCTTAVKCICGYEIEAAQSSHDWSDDWAQDSGKDTHTHKCRTEGCTVSETKPCSGGTAACTAKAKCDTCKAEYGSVNAKNHPNLKHVEAKAATKWSKGNIEYWHCSDCGKYYKDAAATQEITKEQTETNRLPFGGDPSDNPKTGAGADPNAAQDSSMTRWIAVLLALAAAGTFAVIRMKKKKQSEN